jgi:predicted acylesterase/phospholipase RssA
MTIKHLVISGGGTIGLKYLGILQKLNQENIWKIQDIQTIYCTSAGCLLGSILCLNYDWETINKYIIERPWKDVFKLSAKQMVEAYYNKGLYDKKIIETVFKPLLEAKDLSLSITLKELYDYCKIEINIFTFELNSFKTAQLNYKLNPDLSLITAISMSCAVPGLFMPICSDIDNTCYVDGGVMANYPLSFCLEMQYNKEEILGINYFIDNINNNTNNYIHKDSSILDFILGFSINAMNFISNKAPLDIIPNEIVCRIEDSPLSLHFIEKTVKTIEMRKKMIEEGYLNAEEFIQKSIISTRNKI